MRREILIELLTTLSHARSAGASAFAEATADRRDGSPEANRRPALLRRVGLRPDLAETGQPPPSRSPRRLKPARYGNWTAGLVLVIGLLTTMSAPALAQVELGGTYAIRMYEDYIERGPGSFLGDFTGMPMSDEGRAKALRYSSSLPSTIERQCLAQSPWVGLYRPLALRIWSEVNASGRVVAWVMAGDYLRDTVRIWMDGRPHPSANAWHPPSGFTTGHWEGDTLVARTTHVKTAWIRRGVGIPGSDRSTITALITRHENLLTITTIQEDPIYLTEPHVVSRVWEFDPRGSQGPLRDTCNVGVEIPSLEDTGEVPSYLPGQNPEEDFMVRNYNIPKEAAMGYAHTLYPEYRKTLRSVYTPPASCGRYCCGWIERQGLPGAAPGLTCNDGNLPPELRKAIAGTER